MDRRRTVLLILGLIVCLGLLSRWVMRPDAVDAPPTPSSPVTQAAPLATEPAVVEPPPLAAETQDAVPVAGPEVFRGRVIDAVSRQPVRAFQLEFHPHFQPGSPAPEAQSYRTKDGRFAVRGLPDGVWTIYTTARGYQRFELADLSISSSKAVEEILIPMQAGLVLRGRVFDETTNEGVGAAKISFREAHVGRYEGNFRNRPSTTSKADGSFALDGVTPGSVRVAIEAQNYVSRELDVFIRPKAPPLEVALSTGGTITGYLAGADGITPVAGFASLRHLEENSTKARQSSSAGEFTFNRLTAGRYELVGRGGSLSGKREITLSHNERLAGVVLAMSANHNISGVVSGLRPEELQRVNVFLFREGGQDVHSPQSTVDANGAYELTGVSPGRVRIVASIGAGRKVTKVVEMPEGSDLAVNIEFKRSFSLTGRITRGGKPVAGAAVEPNSLTASAGEFLTQGAVTSPEGDYALEYLPDGEYSLIVGYSYVTPSVRVSEDTVFDIEVPESQLAGRVLEEGGKVPVVGAVVGLIPAQPGGNGRRNWTGGTSDHFGQFSVLGLQPGDFLLTAYKPGFELYRVPFAYGSPISDMVIPLRRGRGVEVRVRDAESGKTVSTARALELLRGSAGIVVHLSPDQNGVSYLPGGLAGSSLRISANGYASNVINDWNGQQLEVSLQRQSAQ
ncbi:carboxypeptidase regulatory-like domain-containing protein [Peristeroidobacter agariperforans]|uniref:carboxypeptidase regulatory-like domain-containing protein n=1 Tax=Peristeroidobacter agariperforans TaxID=268404 RepID=UPI00101B9B1F|nr:carboxypeptidase regulatory-like domain-containing protein [Peristeroidobacter agariperforans]